MNRKTFYECVRASVFGNQLTQQNVDGTNALLDYWDAHYKSNDIRKLAYILATIFHETDGTMRWDIVEYGKGKGKPYGKTPYYGRGMIQLTHQTNYQKFSDMLKVDLVKHPDLVLEKENAVAIAMIGMMQGSFTGKRLDQFFTPTIEQPLAARKIVNGVPKGTVALDERNEKQGDKASVIKGYYKNFYKAVEKAVADEAIFPKTARIESGKDAVAEVIDEGKPVLESKTVWGSILAGSGSLGALILPAINSWYAVAVVAILVVGGVAITIWGRKEIQYKTGV